ncbi:hypothetical protein [Paenibacillus fonticola]|uniref:hypothetical protein n=1 Tax=Paenibacillus fonticola TaxID=379896 RepID=UPI00036F62BE|nr:hypothetical protein [Paenibacillus fonticola]
MLSLAAVDIGINIQKKNDLNDGEYYTDPTVLWMNQDFVNVAGTVVGALEIRQVIKSALKSGDLAVYARNIDALDGGMNNVLKPKIKGTGEASESYLSPEMEQKILGGERIPGKLRGGILLMW